jgi:hypothetical protein
VSVPTSETTRLYWYCQACRKSCKVQPPVEEPACRCATPVPSLSPTEVTVLATPKTRPLRALSTEEARLLALARKGTKVRVTFEAEIADAWRWSSAGRSGIDFIVTDPDGRRHTVNGSQSGLRIEAVSDESE